MASRNSGDHPVRAMYEFYHHDGIKFIILPMYAYVFVVRRFFKKEFTESEERLIAKRNARFSQTSSETRETSAMPSRKRINPSDEWHPLVLKEFWIQKAKKNGSRADYQKESNKNIDNFVNISRNHRPYGFHIIISLWAHRPIAYQAVQRAGRRLLFGWESRRTRN